MNKQLSMFGVALLILLVITSVILGLAAGPTNPLTWLLVAFLISIPFVHKKMASRSYIEWEDNYSVGLNSIDLQHKKLISLINQLQTAVDFSTGEEFERDALNAVLDYTKTHFTHEEGLLEQYNYPELEAHKIEHGQMIKHIENTIAEYEKDPDTSINNALDFLKNWLINHINGTDKQYSNYMLEKGAQ